MPPLMTSRLQRPPVAGDEQAGRPGAGDESRFEAGAALIDEDPSHAEGHATLREEIRGQARRAARRRQADAASEVRLTAFDEYRTGRGTGTTRRARPPIHRRPVTGLLALLLAVALTLSISFASPGSDTYRAAVGWHPGGAILTVTGETGELFVNGMPAPGAGLLYEVWLQGLALRRPQAVVSPRSGGGAHSR